MQKEFQFLKAVNGSETEVVCSLCDGKFNVSNGGRACIKQHISSQKHIKGAKIVSSNDSMTSFLAIDPSIMQLQRKELTFAYHSARHQVSTRTADCTSKLVNKLFDSKFSCGATKTSALVRNVISPEIEINVMKTLEKINFVTLITDTSNRKADKMLPVMVRGFDEEKGVQIFKLAVKLIPNETSETIAKGLLEIGQQWKVTEKVVAFGADNCVTNFGGVNRNGDKNVFSRLKKELGREIVGVGCVAHIIHNAFDSACDQLPFNIEALAVNIYKHFHIHTLRVETLKDFCDDSEMEYTKLTNHSGTRFLTLHPAVKKVISLNLYRVCQGNVQKSADSQHRGGGGQAVVWCIQHTKWEGKWGRGENI